MTPLRLVELDPPEEPFDDVPTDGALFQSRCRSTGADFTEQALDHLRRAGATVERRGVVVADVEVAAVVRGPAGRRFLVLTHGTIDDGPRAGLRRSDTLKKAGFDVIALARSSELPVLLLTSHLPSGGRSGRLLAVVADDVFDVVAVHDDLPGFHRLAAALVGEDGSPPPPAPWRRPADQQLGLFAADA